MVEADLPGTTEAQNPASAHLDELDTTELLHLINAEDHRVADAVARAIPQISRAVEQIAASLRAGGRLFYVGAGTSGRLGVLDAAECPPTFGTPPGLVVGLLAGGSEAMFHAVEGAEDSTTLAEADLAEHELSAADIVVGIAASGRTPYVLGALAYARSLGCPTVSIACNPDSLLSRAADIAIELDNGPEVLTGSTRLKAGTSQKMVLNMLSTAAMVRLGKVYGNLMVDVVPTNHKLDDRSVRIVCSATGCNPVDARAALDAADRNPKTAIVMLLGDLDAETARARLAAHDGFVRLALQSDAAPHADKEHQQ